MYFGLIAFGLIAGLTGLVIGLVIQILFLLNLMRLLEAVQPQNRAMSPGLVFLNLIPVFSLGWMIYTVLKIKDSVRSENSSRWGSSVNERNTHTIGLVYAILAAAGFVLGFGAYASRGFSAFGGLISLAVLILWIIYWVRTYRIRKDLEMTAGRGYGPGGQYGAGGPYSPGGQYGAAGYPPPAWQPPTSPPPSGLGTQAPADGSETDRPCVQCGKKLNPGEQFCTACGMPAPRG